MSDTNQLLRARYGLELDGPDVPRAVAALLDRRVGRRYRDEDVPETLLDMLLAAAQSAPTKSDLQQYSIIVMRDRARITRIADWIGTMDWIAEAPVFLVWCGDMRRGQRLCDLRGMTHANNNLDTFLNTAVDCTLAMGQFITAADAVGFEHLPDQLRAQSYREGDTAAGIAGWRLPGGRVERRLAGVPPTGGDAIAAIGGGASRALR